MNKICITGAVGQNTIVGTAASKAPQDVCNILKQYGYDNVYLTVLQSDNSLKRLCSKFIQLCRLAKHTKKDTIIFVQYPLYKFLFIPMLLFKSCAKKQLLIHDLDSIRVSGKLSLLEKMNINCFDEIIVHTTEMKTYLQPYIDKPFFVLNCFDYLLNNYVDYTTQRHLSKDICFAGNIAKSGYLSNFFVHKGFQDLSFYLYGKRNFDFELKANVFYEGVFHPDNVGFLKGSWGLVWDGNDIDTCSGTWGNYLRIIASHKISLYMVAGLPVIVWKQSAMAKFVKKMNIGITINSLADISTQIDSISDVEYNAYLSNLRKLADKLVKGEMTKGVLQLL